MTDTPLPVRRALISVSDKTGIVAFAAFLAGLGVELVSTGGTARALREAGLTVRDVADLSGFPEILDGRVKTLVPQVHGGLLARRDDPHHMAALAEHGIGPIDLLAVNLYPFEATVAEGKGFDECVENIDIGGPALIRAAAKNHRAAAAPCLPRAGGWRPRPMPARQPMTPRSRAGSPPPTMSPSPRARPSPAR